MTMTATSIVRMNRRTGAEIEVCTAESQGFDDEFGKWVTICWTHGMVANWATKAEAVSHAATPDEGCEDWNPNLGAWSAVNSCRDAWEAKGTTSTVYKGHEIEVDKDGHITVWQLDNGNQDGDHWTEPTVAEAKATIDRYQPVTIFGIKEGK